MATDAGAGTGALEAQAEDNDEAIEAWDGPLYDRFVGFRHLIAEGLGLHGERGIEVLAPVPGERILDIGCGFGETTVAIGGLVGTGGEAVGVDASPRFIETAVEEATQAGLANVRYAVADVQSAPLDGPYDAAFSRFGTMFFANPVAALRNVRDALVPGGRLTMVVWRRRMDNDWLYRAQTIVEKIVERPEEYDEPTCGPGPFSMADADTTSEVLLRAGFTDVELRRCEAPILIGEDLDEAIDLVTALGPAGEILRLAGDRASHLHGEVKDALREGLADYAGPDGVRAPASTWIVSAGSPA
jgi:ubiquinone/menaquinone biosynthesis C-methylase UbiE